MDLFNRSVLATVSSDSEIRRFPGIRTSFKVEKTDDFFSNKATISLLNLSTQSRAFIERKHMNVRLDAGYDGKPGLLFNGNVSRAHTDRQKKGADIATVIEAGDGEKSLTESFVDVSLQRGTNNRQALEAVISSMGLVKGFMRDLPLVTFSKGWAFSGRAREAMDLLVRQGGLKWSVQNGELQITDASSGPAEEIQVVTAASGLLNFPSKGTASGTSDVTPGPLDQLAYDWLFECLLNPKVSPGRLVILKSPEVGEARIRVTSTVHEGDSQEGDFKTTAEGVLA